MATLNIDEHKEESLDEATALQETEKKLIADYLEQTSRARAIKSLKCNIETARQGYSQIWRSGIAALDEKLDGGFHPKQLVFLGAISSLGKTSLALQIADNVASSGRDVLIFSLEMDSDELLAKSISRESHLIALDDKTKRNYRFTTQDVLKGNIGDVGSDRRNLFDLALEKVSKANENLFYFIGENNVDVDVIRATIECHKKARRQNPLVIIDYLQIIRPSKDALERRLDKRLLTDDDVTKLKVIARDFEIPVIAISAFNRESYLQTVSTSSFKESSGIEYSSDVLLGMQYMGMEYKKHWCTTDSGNHKKVYESRQDHELRVRELFDKMDLSEERSLELKILKNRNGKKGSVFLEFISPYNYFREIGTDERKPEGWSDLLPGEENPYDDQISIFSEDAEVIEVI